MQKHGLGKLLLIAMVMGCANSAFADLFTFTNIDVPGATFTEAIASGINNSDQAGVSRVNPGIGPFLNFSFLCPNIKSG